MDNQISLEALFQGKVTTTAEAEKALKGFQKMLTMEKEELLLRLKNIRQTEEIVSGLLQDVGGTEKQTPP